MSENNKTPNNNTQQQPDQNNNTNNSSSAPLSTSTSSPIRSRNSATALLRLTLPIEDHDHHDDTHPNQQRSDSAILSPSNSYHNSRSLTSPGNANNGNNTSNNSLRYPTSGSGRSLSPLPLRPAPRHTVGNLSTVGMRSFVSSPSLSRNAQKSVTFDGSMSSFTNPNTADHLHQQHQLGMSFGPQSLDASSRNLYSSFSNTNTNKSAPIGLLDALEDPNAAQNTPSAIKSIPENAETSSPTASMIPHPPVTTETAPSSPSGVPSSSSNTNVVTASSFLTPDNTNEKHSKTPLSADSLLTTPPNNNNDNTVERKLQQQQHEEDSTAPPSPSVQKNEIRSGLISPTSENVSGSNSNLGVAGGCFLTPEQLRKTSLTSGGSGVTANSTEILPPFYYYQHQQQQQQDHQEVSEEEEVEDFYESELLLTRLMPPDQEAEYSSGEENGSTLLHTETNTMSPAPGSLTKYPSDVTGSTSPPDHQQSPEPIISIIGDGDNNNNTTDNNNDDAPLVEISVDSGNASFGSQQSGGEHQQQNKTSSKHSSPTQYIKCKTASPLSASASLPRDEKNPFSASGTSHPFSSSATNFAVIAHATTTANTVGGGTSNATSGASSPGGGTSPSTTDKNHKHDATFEKATTTTSSGNNTNALNTTNSSRNNSRRTSVQLLVAPSGGEQTTSAAGGMMQQISSSTNSNASGSGTNSGTTGTTVTRRPRRGSWVIPSSHRSSEAPAELLEANQVTNSSLTNESIKNVSFGKEKIEELSSSAKKQNDDQQQSETAISSSSLLPSVETKNNNNNENNNVNNNDNVTTPVSEQQLKQLQQQLQNQQQQQQQQASNINNTNANNNNNVDAPRYVVVDMEAEFHRYARKQIQAKQDNFARSLSWSAAAGGGGVGGVHPLSPMAGQMPPSQYSQFSFASTGIGGGTQRTQTSDGGGDSIANTSITTPENTINNNNNQTTEKSHIDTFGELVAQQSCGDHTHSEGVTDDDDEDHVQQEKHFGFTKHSDHVLKESTTTTNDDDNNATTSNTLNSTAPPLQQPPSIKKENTDKFAGFDCEHTTTATTSLNDTSNSIPIYPADNNKQQQQQQQQEANSPPLSGLARPLSQQNMRANSIQSIGGGSSDNNMNIIASNSSVPKTPSMWVHSFRAKHLEGVPEQADPDDEGDCGCSEEEICKFATKHDVQSIDFPQLLSRCVICQRRPAAFISLYDLKAVCPSHVPTLAKLIAAQKEEEEEGEHKQQKQDEDKHEDDDEDESDNVIIDHTLFVNTLDITTAYDRIFWCEKCKTFTWKYTDPYMEFIDRIVQTRRAYLTEPSTDVFVQHYQIRDHGAGSTMWKPSSDSKPSDSSPSPNAIINKTSTKEENATTSATTKAKATPTKTSATNTAGGTVTKSRVHYGQPLQRICVTMTGTQGWRSTQEDAEIVFRVTTSSLGLPEFITRVAPATEYVVLAVFDGHGGDSVAKIAGHNVEHHFRFALHNEIINLKRSLEEEMSSRANSSIQKISSLMETPLQISSSRGSSNIITPLNANISNTTNDNSNAGNIINDNVAIGSTTSSSLGINEASKTPTLSFSETDKVQTTPTPTDQLQQEGEQQQENNNNNKKSEEEEEPSLTFQQPLSGEAKERLNFYEKVLTQTFLSLDRAIQNTPEHLNDALYGMVGSTACIVVITEEDIICASCGDSRAVLYNKRKNATIPLSDDHKLSVEKERKRIESAGYFIRNNRIEGLLAVPRSLGDFDFKMTASSPETQAVTAVPDVRLVPRTSLRSISAASSTSNLAAALVASAKSSATNSCDDNNIPHKNIHDSDEEEEGNPILSASTKTAAGGGTTTTETTETTSKTNESSPSPSSYPVTCSNGPHTVTSEETGEKFFTMASQPPEDWLVLVACDGVWDALTNEEACVAADTVFDDEIHSSFVQHLRRTGNVDDISTLNNIANNNNNNDNNNNNSDKKVSQKNNDDDDDNKNKQTKHSSAASYQSMASQFSALSSSGGNNNNNNNNKQQEHDDDAPLISVVEVPSSSSSSTTTTTTTKKQNVTSSSSPTKNSSSGPQYPPAWYTAALHSNAVNDALGDAACNVLYRAIAKEPDEDYGIGMDNMSLIVAKLCTTA